MELVIYFTNGQTAYFNKVDHLKENERSLSFSYFEIPSKTRRKAFFYKHQIAGVNCTDEEE